MGKEYLKESIKAQTELFKTSSTIATALVAGIVALVSGAKKVNEATRVTEVSEVNYWLAGVGIFLLLLFVRLTLESMKQIDKDLAELKKIDV